MTPAVADAAAAAAPAARAEWAPAERAATPVIAATGLEFRFQPDAAAALFADVSLAVKPREIVCLLGASGCGKSTLLRTLAGLQVPTRGAIEFLGQSLVAPHPRAAMAFQQPSLLPWLSVTGNVGFGLGFRHQPRLSPAAAAERVQLAIDAVGLRGRESLYPSQLSGGMAQRVALARALAREPAVLFADEPFSALDAITRAEMQALLVTLVHRWHSAVVMVTHDIDEAIAIADRILLMGGKPARIVQQWQVPRPSDADPDSLPAEAGALRQDILHALYALLSSPSIQLQTKATP